FTDNKNLLFQGTLSQRINRLKLVLEEFDYELKYIKGENNSEADFISRCSYEIRSIEQSDYRPILLDTLVKVFQHTHDIEKSNEKHKIIKSLEKLHVDLQHPGISKFMKTIENYVKLRGLKKVVSKLCKECQTCNREKDLFHNFGKVTSEFNTSKTNEIIGIDIKCPVNGSHFATSQRYTQFYILVMIDIFSRYTQIDIISDINSSTISNSFEKTWINVFGPPKKCLSDNGRQFISSNFKDLLYKYKIDHITSAPSNPTGNSVVERVNKEIGLVLRISRGTSPKTLKINILRRINCTNNNNIGYSPLEIFHKLPIFSNINKKIKIDHEIIISKLKSNCENYNKMINKKRINIDYSQGDKLRLERTVKRK
ncbi:Transposon Tf2-11 polyprotein, partial [Dictyocoela muelleri]